MMDNEKRPRRRSVRLAEYDYAQIGAYFITVCVQGPKCLLGNVIVDRAELNPLGAAVEACWRSIPDHFQHVELDECVVMPNHVHGIVAIVSESRGTSRRPAAEGYGAPIAGSLATIVRSFKSASTKRVNEHRGTPGARFWQRSFYEHVIRNDDDLANIREYIDSNPARWEMDQLHVGKPSKW